MKTTRQRILECLQTRRHASAQELSHALQVTPANIRHHLAILTEEGVVQVAAQRSPRRRGRPVQIYTLSQQAALHNLDMLVSALLRMLISNSDEGEILQKLAKEMLGESGSLSGSQTTKLSQAVDKLNQMNYQARWEAHAPGPRLILSHCPYLAVLDTHPELCKLDASLIEEMLGMQVCQLIRLEANPQGIPQCVFSLQIKKNNPII